MEQGVLLDKLHGLCRELDRALPDPTAEDVDRLVHMAACLAAEAGVLSEPDPQDRADLLNEVSDLISSLINSNHPPQEVQGTLARHQSLRELFNTLWSIRTAALALSTGDLAVDIDSKGFLSGSLKTLQAHFRHLTWQTQRVADGDFSQRVDFMGEFATAFNAMARRLARTVEALKLKEAELTSKNRELEKEISHRREVERALRESEERYREMAMIDYLTGLYNRRHFYVLAENEIKRSHRHGHDLALLMLDIDRFKDVNDNYGHDCGDRVLVELSRVFTGLIRSVDLCARFGGEEFVLMLPETKSSQALHLAERLREGVARSCVPAGEKWVSVTASIGVSGMVNGKPAQKKAPRALLELLIKQADLALYSSKKAGRNRVSLFQPEVF